MISTRGRYALRVMIDLAEHAGGYTPMKEVAARQGISLKYLEQIMPALSKNGLVEGIHGKGGGYRMQPMIRGELGGDSVQRRQLFCTEGNDERTSFGYIGDK